MITRLIEKSARNPVLVILGVLLLTAGGVWAVFEVPLDAIPDLSDVQTIIFTEWPGRSPTLIEDQITYPIVTSLLAAPGVKRVRGVSEYGFSYVYVIFQDHIDLYWARSRDRKSTRLNSSHSQISYAVFCLKKKTTAPRQPTVLANAR